MAQLQRRCGGNTAQLLRAATLGLSLAMLGQWNRAAGDELEMIAAEHRDYFAAGAQARRGETDGYRFEALQKQARFKGTRTDAETIYEEKVVTYTEPQTVYRTVTEDKSCWEMRCCWGLLGWRTVCCWCPRTVQTQVPEVTNIQRERVERIPHETTRQVRSTLAEPAVVQSRRPYAKKTLPALGGQVFARRSEFEPIETAQAGPEFETE